MAVSYTHLDVYKRQTLGSGRFRLHHGSGLALQQAVLDQARAGHWELWELTPEYADLEQIFVRLTLGGQASA